MTILENAPIAKNTYHLRLKGDTSAFTAPGQFAQVAIPGFFLRRPLSVCDWDEDGMTLIYKVVGCGTAALSAMRTGALDCLNGLGNGFALRGGNPVLVGGGAGVPPLYGLCKHLIEHGAKPIVVLGFNTAEEAFYLQAFADLGVNALLTTMDGSAGLRGLVTDALGEIDFDYVYACGPEPMLRAVYNATETPGQYSFEARMACGFGACMGCTCKTKYGAMRLCKDGPVLEREAIVW